MMGLLRFCFLLGIFCIFSVVGFGVDPTLRINVFDEIKLGESFSGVSQVHGFHNESRAFLFQDSERNIKAPVDATERILKKLRNRSEFTILVTLKQESLNSGVIFSIHSAKQRFLELESSGQRNEIRLHYHTRSQQTHSEVFPYTLADNQWHKVSIAVSASHVLLHVDCNRIYERVVETPLMDIPKDTSFWLGQRNNAHGLFKMKARVIKRMTSHIDSDDSLMESLYEDEWDHRLDFVDTEDVPLKDLRHLVQGSPSLP